MRISRFAFLFLIVICFASCNDKTVSLHDYYLQGETMGTSYHIKYRGEKNLQKEIDNELLVLNDRLSTYIPTSTISRFNKSEKGIAIDKSYFLDNITSASKIYEMSKGLYDPTVMPLINYWGFGYKKNGISDKVDSFKIDSILRFVGFDKIKLIEINGDSVFVEKKFKETELDFSSIAKGYGVDKVSELLELNKVQNYMVEIGGELRCKGLSPSSKPWTVGINTPKEGASLEDLILKKKLHDQAMATSGNYRNFYEMNGRTYSHTINPRTGFPERSNLLSATVTSKDCMTADAIATACMVAGLEVSKDIVAKLEGTEVCLIYLDSEMKMQIYYSEGFKEGIYK